MSYAQIIGITKAVLVSGIITSGAALAARLFLL